MDGNIRIALNGFAEGYGQFGEIHLCLAEEILSVSAYFHNENLFGIQRRSRVVALREIGFHGRFRPKLENCSCPISFSGTKNAGGKMSLVGAVGIMLGFQTKTAALDIRFVGFPAKPAVKEVAAVKLDARRIGVNCQHSAGAWFVHLRGQPKVGVGSAVDHPVVVVAVAKLQLQMGLSDVASDRFRSREVKWCADNGGDFSRGDERLIHRRVMRGVEHKFMSEDVAVAFTFEVEVGMLGQVDGGGFVGCRAVVHQERVLVVEFIAHRNVKITGIAFLLVFGQITKFEPVPIIASDGMRLPHNFVESYDPAVKMIRLVVNGKRIGFAVERKFSLGDAVAISADNGTEVRFVYSVDIVFQPVVAKRDVRKVSVAVGHRNRGNGGAVVGNLDNSAMFVFQSVQSNAVEILHTNLRKNRHDGSQSNPGNKSIESVHHLNHLKLFVFSSKATPSVSVSSMILSPNDTSSADVAFMISLCFVLSCLLNSTASFTCSIILICSLSL